MPIEVGKFTFPVDFVILKMEEDSKVPLILGRPFLYTANAVIRVKQKQLNLEVEDKKPVVQKQRRLNLNMQEVVKKEIVKLLDTGIIYPTADSPLVSPIYCVPKKGVITVVTNKKDELVPTRTITGWRVRIYQKSHENRQKRANTDTGNGRAQEKPKIQSQSQEKVNYVKSRALIDHLSIKATWLWKKAQGEVGFTLGSLREVAQAVTSRMTAWQSLSVHT
ncbi:reverse transcriptase domain-containing protein [Tanacetum coccineum]